MMDILRLFSEPLAIMMLLVDHYFEAQKRGDIVEGTKHRFQADCAFNNATVHLSKRLPNRIVRLM